MLHSFHFSEAAPFIRFLEEHRDKWYGQPILNFYSDVPFAQFTKSPYVFELRDFSVIVQYPCHSDILIHVADQTQVQKDLSLSFLYGEKNIRLSPAPFPCLGQRLTGIKPNRFSYQFQSCFGGRHTRPMNGDYFNFISVSLDGGKGLIIHTTDARYDGYHRVRADPCSFEIMHLSAPINRHVQTMCTIEYDFGDGFDFSEQRLSVSQSALKKYTAGAPTQLPEPYHGCTVTVFTGGACKRVVVLHKSIPTFDSSDRQYDSWHKLVLAQDHAGAIHAIYATGGYEIARIECFARVNTYPEIFRPWFEG